jgi:predicted O-methyltransferase YrrM
MAEREWEAADDFIAGLFVYPDAALDSALEASAKAGLPPIEVSPNQGKLLMLLARMAGAERVLEIGTLGGYSTIWLARALPAGGRLISLEASAKHAEVARRNVAAAGFGDAVDIRVGKALDTLPKLEKEGAGPFDFIFIDADKGNNSAYFEWALKLSRGGSVIFADNVIRGGAVVRDVSEDASVRGARAFLELMAKDQRVSATAIQAVGVKGYDGFALAVVNG